MYKKNKNYHLIISLFIINLFYTFSISANQFQSIFEPLTTRQGLTQNTINDIVQDQQGSIWLGTFNGLNQYDGVRNLAFLHNSPHSPIPENEIYDIELANNGRLWVLSKQFIFYRDPNKVFKNFISLDQLYQKENPLTFTKIISRPNKLILFHSQGVIELSLQGTVLNRYIYPIKTTRRSWFIMQSTPHKNAKLLATSSGLWVLQENSKWYQPENWPDYLKRAFQYTVVPTPTGYLVFGLKHIHILDKELQLISEKSYTDLGLASFPFRASLSSDGILWMATFKKLYKLQIDQFDNNAANLPLATLVLDSGLSINSLFLDKNDGVWVGTLDMGVRYLNKNAQSFQVLNNNQDNNPLFSVSALTSDKQDNIYFGTAGGDIYTMNNLSKKIKKLPLEFDHKRDQIRRPSALLVKENNLWIATLTGLFHYDLNNNQLTHLKPDSSPILSSIITMKWVRDKIWGVSTNEGVFFFDPKINQVVLLRDDINWQHRWSQLNLKDLAHLGKYLYICSDHGKLLKFELDTLRGEEIDVFTDKSQAFYQIIPDKEDNLWLLTSDVLMKYNTLTQTITPQLRAFDYGQTAFYSVRIEKNNLWLGGSTALLYYNPSQNKAVSFSTSDGAIDDEYNVYNIKTLENNLLFSTVTGLLKVDINNELPHTNIDSSVKLSRITHYSKKKKTQEWFTNQKQPISLKQGERIRWQFAPSEISLTNQIKVAYRINNGSWHPVKNWELELNQSQFKSGVSTLEIRSTTKFGNTWKTYHQFTIDAESPVIISPVYYWLMTLGLFVLFLIYWFRNKHLKANIAQQAHLEFKQKSQDILQEQQILRTIAEVIISEMKSFYLLLRPQLAKQYNINHSNPVVGQFIKLSTQIATYQTSYLTNENAIELKPLIEHLIKRYFNTSEKLGNRYQLELSDISSKTSEHFIKHHFALIGLLFQSSQLKSLKITLLKSSARRATLSIHSQFAHEQSLDFEMTTHLFSSLAQILVNCAKPLGIDSELRLGQNLLEWQVTFTATQRWRENLETTTQTSTKINILTNEADKLSQQTQLILINLTNKAYPYALLSLEFDITSYSKLDDALAISPINGTILIAVESISQNEYQQIEQLRNQSNPIIVICYVFIEPNIATQLSRMTNILLLPFSITSPALPPILEFIKNGTLTTALIDKQPETSTSTSVEENIMQGESPTHTEMTDNATSPSNNEMLTKLNEYLETYCADESLDVEKVAYALHLSSRHLTRKLKDMVNLSTAEYIRQYRLNKALVLLRKGYPIGQVGKMTGFSSRNYFSTSFKRHFGVTPSDFRQIE
ncbi:AraC family transcriptional regulator [Aliikangiella sp. IMCC44359]|uniref:AraC family transcriptional regulator n=1 Tax=Aliikangiella sp. IMCC44359 TaxID=3459125 RepID=UPI00403AAFF5